MFFSVMISPSKPTFCRKRRLKGIELRLILTCMEFETSWFFIKSRTESIDGSSSYLDVPRSACLSLLWKITSFSLWLQLSWPLEWELSKLTTSLCGSDGPRCVRICVREESGLTNNYWVSGTEKSFFMYISPFLLCGGERPSPRLRWLNLAFPYLRLPSLFPGYWGY